MMSFLRGRAARRSSPEELPLQNAREHWRCIFDKYDKDKDGTISTKELADLIRSQEYEGDLPRHVITKIHSLADTNKDGVLDFEEFVAMITDPALRPIFGNMVNSYINILVPSKTIKYPTTGQLEDEIRCCPPPISMVVISAVEIIFYVIDSVQYSAAVPMGSVARACIYDPRRRYEAWRYLTYMFVHIGVIHLVVNLCVQILLGTPLEMIHRWWRVLVIYFAGVVAGSLGTSIADPTVKLAGASGGVYALITAHISTIVMNWREMEYPGVQLLIFLIITFCDIGSAIYNRHVLKIKDHIGYAAHFAGALAGLLIGIHIVRNINVTRTEKIIWWVSTIAYIVLMGSVIVWNVVYTDYFPAQDYS